MSDDVAPKRSREELEELVVALRAEIERLREELGRIRRDTHERPPHWG